MLASDLSAANSQRMGMLLQPEWVKAFRCCHVLKGFLQRLCFFGNLDADTSRWLKWQEQLINGLNASIWPEIMSIGSIFMFCRC